MTSLLRRCARFLAEGLIVYGASSAGMNPHEALAALDPGRYHRSGPPVGHPERLMADVPLTSVEYELWSRLPW
ncbi:DUF6059 family protein [Actinoplanes sp. NPDC051494]|uniref:DUF6059 family protein n=1 Tax=Actinoplanes sp. NPDC051494 TaxID=3363907 RepID=UPI003795B824